MSTVDSLFVRVREIISEHNQAIGEGQPGFVQPADFESCIKVMGGTSEDRLKRMSYEDILQCLPSIQMNNTSIKPTALAKAIASVFRGNEDTSKPRPVTPTRASMMTIEELVKSFDPEEYSNAIGKRLKEISRGEPFVVYQSGRVVDQDATLKLLQEVKSGYPGRERLTVNGEVKKVFRVGELPDAYADENPLYPGRALRPDGTCDQTGRSWDGVPLEVRQLVAIAVKLGDLDVSYENAHNLIDLAIKSDAMAALKQRYQKAAAEFTELQKTGSLPKLVVPMRTRVSSSGPLSGGKKVLNG